MIKNETRLAAMRRARRESEHQLGEWGIALCGVAVAACQRAGCTEEARVYETGAISVSVRRCAARAADHQQERQTKGTTP